MEFHLAVPMDLDELELLYRRVVQWMRENGFPIWDDVYPSALLPEDIAGKQLWIGGEDGKIVCAFALTNALNGADDVAWRFSGVRPLYLCRLAVLPEAMRRGCGAEAVRTAAAIARQGGADTLRLFVADSNLPALRFYQKNGWLRADGEFNDPTPGAPLREYGFECPL